MAQSKLAKRSAPPVSPGKSAVARLVREGVLILLLAACAFSVVALTSYHASDPGWSKTGVSHQIQNAGGPAGAWLADVSFSLFGALAYIFPLLIAIQILILLRHRVQPPLDMVTVGLKTVGLFLLMLAGTGLAVQHAAPQFGDLPFSAGGILGMWAADAADAQFGLVGGTLLLLTVFIFGVTIFFDISWFAVMDALGGWALAAVAASQRYLAQEWAAMRERRAMAPVAAAPPKLKRVKRPKAERSEPLVPELMDYDEPMPVEPRLLPQPKPATQLKITPPKPAARQQNLFEVKSSGELPSIGLLDAPDKDPKRGYSAESLQQLSRLLELKLQDFGIVAEVVEVLPGPVVTRFEIQPAPGVKVSRITNLAKDLARSLAVISVRVVEVIEGKSVVGIEIPNQEREMVRLSAVLASAVYEKMRSPLTLALGHDISGQPVVADLAKMPHLLVAGTTGSGKSVGVNAMLLSLLYKAGPDQVRLLLVDPKMLELSIYEGIPHLLAPVITDMKDAATGLRWCVGEMERRYKLMAALGVRNLAGYNKKVQDARQAGEPILDPLWKPDDLGIGEVPERPELATLPFIVVVIDEFADMMMIVGKKVEQLIARIAQKARAAGIHLVLATQRPSVDVITGLIKANIPTRMAFQVSSKIDSRTILDQGGAEQLLGHGDMLYLPPGTSLPVRVHGAFVDDHEVHAVVADWKSRGEPQYLDEIFSEQTESISVPGYSEEGGGGGDGDAESDPLYDEAVAHVLESRKASISSVQRKLRIGYNRAARLIEQMEMAGVVSAMSSNGNRDVIAPPPPR